MMMGRAAQPHGPNPKSGSALVGCGRRDRWSTPALGHELVELGLVLGEPQALQERAKFKLLLFQLLQCVHSVFVEGVVAA